MQGSARSHPMGLLSWGPTQDRDPELRTPGPGPLLYKVMPLFDSQNQNLSSFLQLHVAVSISLYLVNYLYRNVFLGGHREATYARIII